MEGKDLLLETFLIINIFVFSLVMTKLTGGLLM